ncbi:hypothetical protein RHSIM_Rhsim10G0075300 [Rhododendron simsii]|uniref:Thiamine pyrophosphate enzyme central domain-containing protein n=1 Tax=Rhododendron simsii TaxID=118357 RepID=A0A834GEC5_RHOSS|nr:hypothetical protein RHSIM_Rhsim10G0075300 [Rhododendron simsii]
MYHSEIEKAVSLLPHAERPLIVFGKGAEIARAENGLKKLVETIGLPVLPTSMGKGLLPPRACCNSGVVASHW